MREWRGPRMRWSGLTHRERLRSAQEDLGAAAGVVGGGQLAGEADGVFARAGGAHADVALWVRELQRRLLIVANRNGHGRAGQRARIGIEGVHLQRAEAQLLA